MVYDEIMKKFKDYVKILTTVNRFGVRHIEVTEMRIDLAEFVKLACKAQDDRYRGDYIIDKESGVYIDNYPEFAEAKLDTYTYAELEVIIEFIDDFFGIRMISEEDKIEIDEI